MNKIKIYYLLNEAGRKHCLLSGGKGEEKQVIEADINERNLKFASVSEDGQAKINIGFGKYEKNILVNYKECTDELGDYIKEIKDIKYFDKVMTANELIKWEEDRVALLTHIENKYKSAMEERNKKLKEKEEREEARRTEEKERRLKEIKEKENILKEEKLKKEKEFIDERNKWINENGSEYLKDAIELKYGINNKYVIERANKEFTEYDVDINDNASWESRYNPSEEALGEVKKLVKNGVNAQVVWLTSPVNEENKYYFEYCEAVVIRGYLGRYDLVKEVS